MIAAPRGEVVLKRLRLPKTTGAGDAELAGMVRLQMARQLTMAIEGTAIDYVTIESGARGVAGEAPTTAPGSAGTLDVLAAALPADRMQWYVAMAEAAGCSIERVGLRASGAAATASAGSRTRAALPASAR